MARLVVRDLGADTDYMAVLRAMRAFTDERTSATADELWLTQHRPVFTQGQAGKAEFLLNPGNIPVVQSDRGGQVTYHGPGQIVGYLMFDLHRLGLGVRGLVSGIENALIALLGGYGISACARPDAPGVYVGNDKIAALGLRVRRGRSYHGLALNVDMDLAPYAGIVPCGLAGTGVTTLATLLSHPCATDEVAPKLVQELALAYGFDGPSFVEAAYLPLSAGNATATPS